MADEREERFEHEAKMCAATRTAYVGAMSVERCSPFVSFALPREVVAPSTVEDGTGLSVGVAMAVMGVRRRMLRHHWTWDTLHWTWHHRWPSSLATSHLHLHRSSSRHSPSH